LPVSQLLAPLLPQLCGGLLTPPLAHWAGSNEALASGSNAAVGSIVFETIPPSVLVILRTTSRCASALVTATPPAIANSRANDTKFFSIIVLSNNNKAWGIRHLRRPAHPFVCFA